MPFSSCVQTNKCQVVQCIIQMVKLPEPKPTSSSRPRLHLGRGRTFASHSSCIRGRLRVRASRTRYNELATLDSLVRAHRAEMASTERRRKSGKAGFRENRRAVALTFDLHRHLNVAYIEVANGIFAIGFCLIRTSGMYTIPVLLAPPWLPVLHPKYI